MKKRLKLQILSNQKIGDSVEWNEENFEFEILGFRSYNFDFWLKLSCAQVRVVY